MIPCYKYHINKLLRLLNSIEAQTRKPDLVVVSCSSTKEGDFPKLEDSKYSFPLKILLHEERRNAAENRNMAAMLVDTSYISFFDADDIMHPQRLEAIEYVIQKTGGDLIMHSFLQEGEGEFINSEIFYSEDVLERAPSGCVQKKGCHGTRIHHSQATIKRDIFKSVQYREEAEFERREDAVFCGDVVALPHVKNVYIHNPLSKYDYEGAWYS